MSFVIFCQPSPPRIHFLSKTTVTTTTGRVRGTRQDVTRRASTQLDNGVFVRLMAHRNLSSPIGLQLRSIATRALHLAPKRPSGGQQWKRTKNQLANERPLQRIISSLRTAPNPCRH